MAKMTQKNYEGIKIYRQKMKIFELKGLVQRLGNNVEDLTLQKDLLIVENNKLRGLLKECRTLCKEMIEVSRLYKRGKTICPCEENIIELSTRIDTVIGECEA